MKKIDATVVGDIVGAVIMQCKRDIAKYLKTGRLAEEAVDAIQFIMGKDFEYYMIFMGMPKEDFDLYRKAIIQDSVRMAKKKKND